MAQKNEEHEQDLNEFKTRFAALETNSNMIFYLDFGSIIRDRDQTYFLFDQKICFKFKTIEQKIETGVRMWGTSCWR